MGEAYVVFTFPSTYHALKAEKALKEKGYSIPLSPIPRELTSNCGEVIRIVPDLRQRIHELLLSAGVQVEEIHHIEPQEKSGLFDKFFGF